MFNLSYLGNNGAIDIICGQADTFVMMLHIYTNDQHIYHGTRSFIYADNLCVTAQYPSFTDVEEIIRDALEESTQYYRSNSLRANPDKTQVTAFHLRNKEVTR